MQQEIWKEIEGFEGRYEISNQGRVRSRVCPGVDTLIMHPTLRVRGKYHKVTYRHICLRDINGKQVWKYIHVLVAKAFIPNPENKPFVDHINGTEWGDSIDNLRWCTHKENISFDLARKHISEGQKGCRSHWYGKFGGAHAKAKSVGQYSLDGRLMEIYSGVREATRQTGVSNSSISLACRGKLVTAGGFLWRYIDEL